MPLLTIKTDEYGIGLYRNGKPWRYHKHGNDIVTLLLEIIPNFDTVQHGSNLTDDERERDFC